VRLVDGEHLAGAGRLQRAVVADLILGDHGVAVAVGVVDVRQWLRRVEGQTEQPLLAAAGEVVGELEHRCPGHPVAYRHDGTALQHHEQCGVAIAPRQIHRVGQVAHELLERHLVGGEGHGAVWSCGVVWCCGVAGLRSGWIAGVRTARVGACWVGAAGRSGRERDVGAAFPCAGGVAVAAAGRQQQRSDGEQQDGASHGCVTRTRPSCTTLMASVPSAVKMLPPARPRAPPVEMGRWS